MTSMADRVLAAGSAPRSCCTGGRSCPAGTTSPTPWPTSSTLAGTRTRSCSPAITTSRENAGYLREARRRRALRRRTTTGARSCPPNSTPRSSPPGAVRNQHAAVPQDLLRRLPPPISVADYNGHWGVRELCDICPAAQQHRCAATPTAPGPGDLDRVLAQLGYDTRLPDRRRPRLDPRPGRAAPLRHPARARLPDLGTRPAALAARPRPRPAPATSQRARNSANSTPSARSSPSKPASMRKTKARSRRLT